MNSKKKLVIVGGGTAGWLSALFLKKKLSHIFDITVIESSKIGILGAGEGSTPQLVSFFESLNISLKDLVQHAGATIKNGIKFTNWLGDGTSYYHSFSDGDEYNYFKAFKFNDLPSLVLEHLSNENNNLDDITFSSVLSELKKVKFTSQDIVKNKIKSKGFFSIHFNAIKLAGYLKQVAIERGVKYIEGEVTGETIDLKNNIKTLSVINVSETSSILDVDFLIDCTGFKRRFLGEVYKEKWIDYSSLLPVNIAVPFFIKYNENESIPPYTESIAMKYGWMWKIPVEGRYGCGYVFDSGLISEDEALEEIKNYLGFDITSPKTFKFKAGHFERTWVNNVVAIGLAGGFIEPLEATSIWQAVGVLMNFESLVGGYLNNDIKSINEFNQRCSIVNTSIFNFVYFHYLTNRADTKFWLKFKDNSIPNYLKKFTMGFSLWYPWLNNFLEQYNIDPLFPNISYLQVGEGTKQIDRKVFKNMVDMFFSKHYLEEVKQVKTKFVENFKIDTFINHNDFLNFLKK